MVPEHGFARVGTMQVQAIMPPLIPRSPINFPGYPAKMFVFLALEGHSNLFGPTP